jgi:glycolate oxidase iron-sulfur subunit
MLGCAERALYPAVSRAVLRLVPDAVDVPSGQGCCGALAAHNGSRTEGERLARALGETLPGTVLTTAGGCAAHLAHVLGRDRVVELSQYLHRHGTPPLGRLTVHGRPLRVGLQDSCHLRHGLGETAAPRALIARVAEYVELPSAGSCCGAAGTYAVLRPETSAAVLDPHLDEIAAAGVDVVVAVNPGCQRQLEQGLAGRGSAVRVLHLAELLARALGPDAG